MSTADLDAERGGDFWYRFDGEEHQLPDPVDLDWARLTQLLREPLLFILDLLGGQRVSVRQAERLTAAWLRHFGLGTARTVNLAEFMLDRYRNEIEYDLAMIPGAPSLGDLFRSRQIRRLMNFVDHLPPNSHTNAAIAKNEEHVKMMVDAGLKASEGVSQVYYSAEAQRIDSLIDVTNRVGDILIAVNSSKGKRSAPSKPQPRPKSAFGKLRHQARMEQHNALASRLLPTGNTIGQVDPRPRVAGERRRDRRLIDGTAVAAPGSSTTFVGKGRATRDTERQERWADRAREVGRVPQSSDPATQT